MNSLSCRSLTAGYGRLVVCRSIDLHVAAGEFLALLGPNGAGKSTLFQVITGMVKPSQGRVHIYGSGPRGHICIG